MVCHGCHGPLGGGAHNGSAPGMNVCTLLHHFSCPGGILRDDWRPCPPLSSQQQQMPNVGFENTMASQDFVESTPMHSQQLSGNNQYNPNNSQPSQLLISPGQNSHHISPTMQQQIDSHRVYNQNMNENMDRPPSDDLTIRDLRADPIQQNLVDEQMNGFQEQIPALFPAPTAPIPHVEGDVGSTAQGVQQTHTEQAPVTTQSTLPSYVPPQPQCTVSHGVQQPVQHIHSAPQVPLSLPVFSLNPGVSMQSGPHSTSAGGGVHPPTTGPTQPSVPGQTYTVPSHQTAQPATGPQYMPNSAPHSTSAGGGVHPPTTGPTQPTVSGQTYTVPSHQTAQPASGQYIPSSTTGLPQHTQSTNTPHSQQQYIRSTGDGGAHGSSYHNVHIASGGIRPPAHGHGLPAQHVTQPGHIGERVSFSTPQYSQQLPLPPQMPSVPQPNTSYVRDGQQQGGGQSQGGAQPQGGPAQYHHYQAPRPAPHAHHLGGGGVQQQTVNQPGHFLPRQSTYAETSKQPGPGQWPGQQQLHQRPLHQQGTQHQSASYPQYSQGQNCNLMSQLQPTTRTEYRCSPQSGNVYAVQVTVQPAPPPPVQQYEWRCDPQTGRTYQVQVPALQSPYVSGQAVPPPPPPPPVRIYEWRCDPQTGNRYQIEVTASQKSPYRSSQLRSPHSPPWTQQEAGIGPQQYQHPEDFNQQLQKQMKGIVKLCEGGVTKKGMKTLDFAKKGSAKWAKKANIESINLPLFTLGAISELESSLSGRTESLSEGDFLAKLQHIKNYLDVCCLNSEPTDFKGYGWSIAKDYAMKVEEVVEQNLTTWEAMPGGVQTSQLLLAQMDCPKPSKTAPKVGSGISKEKEVTPATKPRCPTYNSCKTDDKCEYEVSNPDKKCLFKHDCNWCKKNLRQSWNHQEWNCKKKN